MKCYNCGKKVKKGAGFCTWCGAQVHIQTKPARGKGASWGMCITGFIVGITLCALILAALTLTGTVSGLFFGGNRGGSAMRFEGDGYDAAEDAIVAYLEAMKQGDVYGMIQTCAIETYVENYDLAYRIESTGAVMPGMEQRLLNDNEYTQAINVVSRLRFVTNNLDDQFLYLTGYEDVYSMVESIRVEEDEIPGYLEILGEDDWMETLASLEIGEIYIDEDCADAGFSEHFRDDQFKKAIRRNRKACGADDYVTAVAEIELDGRDYYFCVDVVCYGDSWYIGNLGGLSGSLMGLPTYYGGICLKSDF